MNDNNLEGVIARLERDCAAADNSERRPQVHLWLNGDVLPHSTPEERKQNFLPAHINHETGKPLDPNRDIVVHWHRPERLAELGYEEV